MNIARYARIEHSSRPREIILLKAFPCSWGLCTFCDYIHDNSEDESAINATNDEVLQKVTGCYGALQVINSGSCFEIPAASLQLIKEVVQRCQIKQLYFESHWSYRHRLNEMREFFGIPITFITGVETFDDRFRNQVLKKGMAFKDAAEVRSFFQSVCLMVGMQGQTREMISNDVRIALETFDFVTINLFVDNTTGIKADAELQAWFKTEFAWLQQHNKVDILFENTDFGVGGEIKNMTNSHIWLLLLLVNYLLLGLSFRLFKAYGLFAWVALASVLANIQVVKTIELFGMVTTLGNIIYGTSFLATDILSECYSEKEAKQAVKIGMFSMLATTVIMQICLMFEPHASDTAQGALHSIFSIMPRIALASITAYFVSQNFDVWFYGYLKIKFPEHLWIRNNGSTMLSQMIDNVIFTLMAFWGVFELDVLLQIFASTYALKWIVALCDTPVIYWARWQHQRDQGSQNGQANFISEPACDNSAAEFVQQVD